MPDLLLKRIGRRGEEHYDVLADGTVVGRIMMFADTPAGKPWMWSLAYGQHEDRTPTHGYEPTREATLLHHATPPRPRCKSAIREFGRQVFRILSRIGIAPMRFAPLVALSSAVICVLLFGCSPAAMGPTTFLADPGKYDYYNCEQLGEQRKIAADRELELKLLMDKAERGPGGAAVNVIAYQGDYLMAREELK